MSRSFAIFASCVIELEYSSTLTWFLLYKRWRILISPSFVHGQNHEAVLCYITSKQFKFTIRITAEMYSWLLLWYVAIFACRNMENVEKSVLSVWYLYSASFLTWQFKNIVACSVNMLNKSALSYSLFSLGRCVCLQLLKGMFKLIWKLNHENLQCAGLHFRPSNESWWWLVFLVSYNTPKMVLQAKKDMYLGRCQPHVAHSTCNECALKISRMLRVSPFLTWTPLPRM